MITIENLDHTIQTLLKKYPNTEKIFTPDKPPQNLSVKTLKKFKSYVPQQETIKLGAIYVILGFITLGFVITHNALHYRLQNGFMALPKSGHLPLKEITHLKAEHRFSHPCYKGSNPGPAFWVNNQEIGWTQVLMVMSDEDEAFLIDLFNHLTPKI
jgi:hypothetical protein